MKFKLFIVCAIGVVVGYFANYQSFAQQQSSRPQLKIESISEKASYGIGYQMGGNFKAKSIELDLRVYLAGLQDGLAGRDSAVDEKAIDEAMMAMEKEILTKKGNRAQAFIDKNKTRDGVQVTKSGLQYKVLKEGKGGASPKLTDTFTAHYHGRLIDGSVFDSSLQGQPLTLGVNQVIDGWKEALQLMKVGDKWQLYIQPNLAYGVNGSPPNIGPYEVLVFDIELLDFKTGAPSGAQ